MSGPVEQSITAHLEAAFSPTHLAVENESHQHSGPAAESHFHVVVISTAFEGQTRVARHRAINQALKAELDAGLHALRISAMTPVQWAEKNGQTPDAPKCHGGSKANA